MTFNAKNLKIETAKVRKYKVYNDFGPIKSIVVDKSESVLTT